MQNLIYATNPIVLVLAGARADSPALDLLVPA